jgi:hypothetical protein
MLVGHQGVMRMGRMLGSGWVLWWMAGWRMMLKNGGHQVAATRRGGVAMMVVWARRVMMVARGRQAGTGWRNGWEEG